MEILTAAAKRLLDEGPNALRIADVAADIGMSHPTLLHHIGSREELLQSATAHLMQRSAARTLEAMQQAGHERDIEGFVRQSLGAFRDVGRTRATAWLALTGRLAGTPRPPWEPFIAAAKAVRRGRHGEHCDDRDEDTRSALVLAFLAIFALDLIGAQVLADAGLGEGEGAAERFVAWMARLLHETLEREPS